MKTNSRLVRIGKQWIERHLHNFELFHHGIKGQKWGIRNGPPYPLAKSSKNSIIEEAIRTGKVKKTINREKQLRHTKKHHLPGRSYIDGDLVYAQKLVDELSGTGQPVMDSKGNWTHQERDVAKEKAGIYVDNITKKETRTDKLMIVYSGTGTHIYPRKEKN